MIIVIYYDYPPVTVIRVNQINLINQSSRHRRQAGRNFGSFRELIVSLLSEAIQPNHWCELRACAYYDAFDKPKIIYPVIGKEPRFAFDTSGAFTNDKAFIIPANDLYLIGVLNSSPIWDYLKGVCSVIGDAEKGGRLELRSIYVSKLPIPDAPESERQAISALVQECLDAKGVGCEAWEVEIDARVAALYGLS